LSGVHQHPLPRGNASRPARKPFGGFRGRE
jgi:hypothetical protein